MVEGDGFYKSREWLDLRYRVLRKFGQVCMLCGQDKGRMHVDHIRPRSKAPALALNFDNLQVLCEECNLGKSNKDSQDFRTTEARCRVCWEEFGHTTSDMWFRQGFCSKKCRKAAIRKIKPRACPVCARTLPRKVDPNTPLHYIEGYCSRRCMDSHTKKVHT